MKAYLPANLLSVALGAVLALIISLLLNAATPKLFFEPWPLSVLFYALLCFLLNAIYTYYRHSTSLTQLLLAGTIVRFITALVIVILFLVSDAGNFVAFAVHFVIHYMIFTFFEIRYLFKLIKSHVT